MKIIKLKYAVLATVVLVAGASVPPLVHALNPIKGSTRQVSISSAPLASASSSQTPTLSSQAPTLEQIQKLQLHDGFTLKYTLVEKDVRTPEMKAADLKGVIDSLLDEPKDGSFRQSDIDRAVASYKAGYALPTPPQEYRVILSARDGKLLIVCQQQGVHSYGLDVNLQPVVEPYINTIFLYDGQTSYWYTSLGKTLHWQQGFRTSQGLQGPSGAHIVPGIGLPYLPLAKASKAEDAVKAGLAPADLLQQPGDTGRRCAVRTLDIGNPDGKADIYVPGLIYAQNSPLGLKLTKMLTGTADNPGEEWEYQEPRVFEGVWLPYHVRWTSYQAFSDGKPVHPVLRSVEDCQITEALATSLPPLQFDMRTYLPANAVIGVYPGELQYDKELRFPYNPTGGTLEEQYQSAVNKQGNRR